MVIPLTSVASSISTYDVGFVFVAKRGGNLMGTEMVPMRECFGMTDSRVSDFVNFSNLLVKIKQMYWHFQSNLS